MAPEQSCMISLPRMANITIRVLGKTEKDMDSVNMNHHLKKMQFIYFFLYIFEELPGIVMMTFIRDIMKLTFLTATAKRSKKFIMLSNIQNRKAIPI